MAPLLAVLAFSALGAIALMHAARDKTAGGPEPQPFEGLPPLSPERTRAVIREAEEAAIRYALGGLPAQANPYPPQTRAHILWETQFHSVLMDWDVS